MKHTKESLAEYKQLKSEGRNPDNKPVVLYYNPPEFFPGIGDWTQASVMSVDHPKLGLGRVYTSMVLKRYDDDTFETRNTIYVRFPEDDLADG